jgi:hypothetical protein
MPIRVRYKNDSSQECTVRPTPLVAVSTNILKNAAGEAFGVTYAITLTGSILPDEGTPYAINHANGSRYDFHVPQSPSPSEVGPYDSFDNNVSHTQFGRPAKQKIDVNESATAILSKQKSLKALFAQDGQRIEITDINYDLPAVICYPRLVSVDFTEGPYVTRSDYTIVLEADTLLFGQGDEDSLIVDQEGTLIVGTTVANATETDLLETLKGAFIADFSEDWSLEVDEEQGESVDLPRSYRISHSLTATGKTHYKPDGTKLDAWVQAKTFVQNRMSDGINDYPNVMGKIGSGTLNLVEAYGGFNQVRTENLSESAGTYNITENWFIAQGTAYENYNLNVSTSNTDPFVNVNIDGNIKGLSQLTPSGYGGNDTAKLPNAYDNALIKYHEISNAGQFGVGCDAYKRANNSVAVQLNSQPVSVTLGTNEFTGDVSYSLGFNNRPTNIISGVVAETISINDSYPGDIFAVIPVLGRTTGPVLQYIGGRTEYKRDVSINLTMDYTKVPYGYQRNPLLLKKPSVVEPTATQISDLLKEVSPQGEPGVRKYFVSPPSENWNPKEGTYSFNISFTYEMDK